MHSLLAAHHHSHGPNGTQLRAVPGAGRADKIAADTDFKHVLNERAATERADKRESSKAKSPETAKPHAASKPEHDETHIDEPIDGADSVDSAAVRPHAQPTAVRSENANGKAGDVKLPPGVAANHQAMPQSPGADASGHITIDQNGMFKSLPAVSIDPAASPAIRDDSIPSSQHPPHEVGLKQNAGMQQLPRAMQDSSVQAAAQISEGEAVQRQPTPSTARPSTPELESTARNPGGMQESAFPAEQRLRAAADLHQNFVVRAEEIVAATSSNNNNDLERLFDPRLQSARSSQPQTNADEADAQPLRQLPPAFARAVQVDHQLRFESLASAIAMVDSTPPTNAQPVNSTLSALGTTLKADNSAQQLPMTSAQMQDETFTMQVTRGLSTMLNQRGGTMTMRLDPPELGELRVQMTISRGSVSASFHAANPQAHALLEQNLTALRTSLESQGMTVDRLVVHAQPSTGQHSMRDEGHMNGQHRHHHHDAAGGESRGRHDDPSHDDRRRYPTSDFINAFALAEQS